MVIITKNISQQIIKNSQKLLIWLLKIDVQCRLYKEKRD